MSAVESGKANANATNINDIGKVYASRPDTVDDLTKIGGVDAAAAKRLNEAGIWQYDQLHRMTARQATNLQQKLNLPRIDWDSLSGLSGAASTCEWFRYGYQRCHGKRSAASTANINQADIGKVYASRPDAVDDLTKIGGVDAAAAKRLNEAGIWQYDQLHRMTARQAANLQQKLDLPHIDWDSLSGLSGATSTATFNSTNAAMKTAATIKRGSQRWRVGQATCRSRDHCYSQLGWNKKSGRRCCTTEVS